MHNLGLGANMFHRAIAAAFTLFCFISSSCAQGNIDQKIQDEVAKLNWKLGVASHPLLDAQSTIATSKDDAFLVGPDAEEFLQLSEGHSGLKADALVVKIDGPLADSSTTYDFAEIGYLEMKDWEEHIDPAQILSVIQANTEAMNKQRAAGYPKLSIDGWLEEPKLDRQSATVYWAFALHDDKGQRLVNARAMKLGRKGAVNVTWAGTPEMFRSASAVLQPALDAYRYNDGARYADFRPGVDTVAAVGVGAVVYKALTGSSKKVTTAAGAGLVAIALMFAKKLWFLLFVPFVFAWNWVRRFFSS
jgi:uncharacterized membrane-anchored protein